MTGKQITDRSRSLHALTFSVIAVGFALAATQAYASDQPETNSQSQVTIYEKTDVSLNPPVLVRVSDVPERPLVRLDRVDTPLRSSQVEPIETPRYQIGTDLRRFDLVDDNPVFIGVPGLDEYDQLEAQRASGHYPKSLNVDPLFTVAGAGVSTQF